MCLLHNCIIAASFVFPANESIIRVTENRNENSARKKVSEVFIIGISLTHFFFSRVPEALMTHPGSKNWRTCEWHSFYISYGVAGINRINVRHLSTWDSVVTSNIILYNAAFRMVGVQDLSTDT